MKAMHSPNGKSALWLAILLFSSLGGFMAWTVITHVSSGETRMPSKRVSLQHSVFREQEPVSFWACVTIYSLVGLGSGALALWGCREAWRLRQVGRKIPGTEA